MDDDEGSTSRRLGKWLLFAILAGAVALIAFLFYPAGVVSYGPEPQIVEAQEVEEQLTAPEPEKLPTYTAATENTLDAISWCESRHRQFDANGDVLMNTEGSSATGRYQIMASVWEREAERLGFDIHTEAGNKAMARYILIEAQGIYAWSASADCLAGFGIVISS